MRAVVGGKEALVCPTATVLLSAGVQKHLFQLNT